MRLRLAILRAELKFVLLLAAELLFLNPATLLLIAFFPGYLLLLAFWDGGIYVTPVGIFLAILLAAVIIRKIQLGSGSPAADPPVSKSLQLYPALEEVVHDVAAQMSCSPPDSIQLALSPVPWLQFGVDLDHAYRPGRTLPVPLCCLQVWSVLDLQAHIARSMFSRYRPVWLVKLVKSAIERLGAEQYQAQFVAKSHWLVRARDRALQRYVNALSVWRFLIDLEVDFKTAKVLGADAVMSLIYKTELAKLLIPTCIKSLIEPAIEKRALLPIVDSCAVYISSADPHCKDAVSQALKEIERSPELGASSFITRLAAVSTIPTILTSQDPRTAASLFGDYRVLEREVAINEFGFRRIESTKDVDAGEAVRLVVIPQIKQEVARNGALLSGKNRFDIPALLRDKSDLARLYRSDNVYPLATAQQEERIAYLLGAFLALELVQEQWIVSFHLADGIELRSGDRRIQPFSLVEELDADAISASDFIAAVQ